MTMYLTPEIGATGKYKYKTPFDTLGNNQTEFTCQSVRTLTDCLSVGENAFKKYYEPYGLTDEHYQQDLKQAVSIVGLQATTGNWLYIPNSYLLSYPDLSGVRYVTMVIAADVGVIPETLNLDVVMGDVQEVLFNRLGINPEVKAVVTSQPALVSYDDHERLENIRKSAIVEEKSMAAQIVDLKSQVTKLTVQNNAMSNYIKTHLP